MDPNDPYRFFAPFDARRAPLVLEHEGSIAELRELWQQLRERHREAAMINLQTPGLILVMVGTAVVLLIAAPLTFGVLGWIGLGLIALALYTYRRMDVRNRRELLDSRKAEIIDALIPGLARRAGDERELKLRADFRSPRKQGSTMVTSHSELWTAALPPESEPATHDWLSLELPDPQGGCSVAIFMRSLYGQNLLRMQLRDELQLQLRGSAVRDDAKEDALVGPRTERTGMELAAGAAKLSFRGLQAASAEPPSMDLGDSAGLEIALFVLRPVTPESWRQWDIDNYEGLLDGASVIAHLDAALAQLAPKAKLERPAART